MKLFRFGTNTLRVFLKSTMKLTFLISVTNFNKFLIFSTVLYLILYMCCTKTRLSHVYSNILEANKAVNQKDNTVTRHSHVNSHLLKANKSVYQMDDHGERRQARVCDPISSILTKKVNLDPNIREITCNCCFQHNFSYLINNRNICKTTEPDQGIDLFIMIFTQHINFIQRQAFRQTWLTISKSNTANVRYVFLLGKVKSVELSKDIAQENDLYKDFLKEDFIDTYDNQTLKTIMGFKWISNYCRTAKFVLKSDDDTFINVPNLLKYIKTSGKELQTQLAGSCRQTEPIRELDSKWYTSKQHYKERLYPWHCSGSGYFTSFTIIEKIYKISPYVPFFWIEDIYVGLCVRKIGGTVKHVKGFNRVRQTLDPCLYKGDKLFTSHEVTPQMLRMVWNASCKTAKYKYTNRTRSV